MQVYFCMEFHISLWYSPTKVLLFIRIEPHLIVGCISLKMVVSHYLMTHEYDILTAFYFDSCSCLQNGQGNFLFSSLFQSACDVIHARIGCKFSILIVRSHVTKREKISCGAYGVVYKGIYHGGASTIDDLKREVASVCHSHIYWSHQASMINP